MAALITYHSPSFLQLFVFFYIQKVNCFLYLCFIFKNSFSFIKQLFISFILIIIHGINLKVNSLLALFNQLRQLFDSLLGLSQTYLIEVVEVVRLPEMDFIRLNPFVLLNHFIHCCSGAVDIFFEFLYIVFDLFSCILIFFD